MKKIIFYSILVGLLLLGSCLSSESAIKGTMTTIDTLGGSSYEAIVLLENMYESAKIAHSDDGTYILYVNAIEHSRLGSVIIYTDGNRHTVANPTDWNLDHVSVSKYGTALYKSINSKLNVSIIDS